MSDYLKVRKNPMQNQPVQMFIENPNVEILELPIMNFDQPEAKAETKKAVDGEVDETYMHTLPTTF